MKRKIPRHSVWNIFNAGPAVQAFGPAYALVVPDLYPIVGPNPNPWRVPQYLAGDVPRFKQPYLLTDQIFAGGCGWTVPTLGQWRLMVYGAMAEGVKGFFHFLYATTPLYRCPDGERLYGGMVDVYGTSSPIYREMECRLGPDLFSFGELLRTCHPDQVPAAIRVESAASKTTRRSPSRPSPCGDWWIQAAATDVFTIQQRSRQGTDRHVAHSRSVAGRPYRDGSERAFPGDPAPMLLQVEGERVPVQLDAGDGRFWPL